MTSSWLTIPNLLSLLRMTSTPVLLGLAWHGYPRTFLTLLALAFFSDLIDGMIARWLNQISNLGAVLDSCSDVAIYTVIAVGGWWLWPELMRQEVAYVWAVIMSFALPSLAGYAKFHTATSYHTWAVKIAVAAVGASCLWMFATGNTWPFRLAGPFAVLAACEELVITAMLPEPRSDVRTLWHVVHALRAQALITQADHTLLARSPACSAQTGGCPLMRSAP
ncbi:MAG: CDP-alcohol phosphatidyltransferase family protein [Burkholderiales bacterium]